MYQSQVLTLSLEHFLALEKIVEEKIKEITQDLQ